MAPSVFLGYFFGRIGCLFNGCCYGGVCDRPWKPCALSMSAPTLAYTALSTPLKSYSAILALILFAFMQRAKKMPRFTRFPGQLILLFWALYACERAFVEIFRNGATASNLSLGVPPEYLHPSPSRFRCRSRHHCDNLGHPAKTRRPERFACATCFGCIRVRSICRHHSPIKKQKRCLRTSL